MEGEGLEVVEEGEEVGHGYLSENKPYFEMLFENISSRSTLLKELPMEK